MAANAGCGDLSVSVRLAFAMPAEPLIREETHGSRATSGDGDGRFRRNLAVSFSSVCDTLTSLSEAFSSPPAEVEAEPSIDPGVTAHTESWLALNTPTVSEELLVDVFARRLGVAFGRLPRLGKTLTSC
jgi:hypothetical protein